MITTFDEPLINSRFAHFFRNSNEVCAYHALTMRRTYYAAELQSHIESCIKYPPKQVAAALPPEHLADFEKALRSLGNLGILIPRDFDDSVYLQRLRERIRQGPQIRVMVLHLTDFCNLKCRYCFVEGQLPDSYQREKMSEQVIEASIRFFSRVLTRSPSRKPPTIVFYGGEPLLNWQTMEHGLNAIAAAQTAERLPRSLRTVVITNGTKISDKIAATLRRFDVHVAVSLDGPKAINDANRIDRREKGTFDQVVKGISTLKNHQINPTISAVMSNASPEGNQRTLDFLLGDLGVVGIGFNHVSISPGAGTYDAEYEERYADAVLAAQDYILDNYPDVYERRMSPRIRNFRRRLIQKADCTGCGEQISISPQGDVGICQGYMGSRHTFSHSVFDEDYTPADDPTFIEWSTRSPLNMAACLDCPAIATCGGGCPRNADALKGSIWERDEPFCHFAKKAQEWLVWNVR